jgi:prepilin-type N-terminal cleavage/methylation domain-containing protein
MKRCGLGFTLIEVLLALVVLGIGILALTGSSAIVTRMIGRGKVETQAALAASRRLEILRLAAGASNPRCRSAIFASGGPVTTSRLTESWAVASVGSPRRVRVTVTYLTVRGGRSAVLETAVPC